jgi:archaellum biogenesis ATPase FlaH
MRIEETVLRHLIHKDSFARKALPFLRDEYFSDPSERIIFHRINEFTQEYNSVPSQEALQIDLEKIKNLSEDEYSKCVTIIKNLNEPDPVDEQWLVDATEEFCQERAIYNAIMDSIGIIDGKDKARTKGSIPEILSSALAVSFDSHIGHDFLEDYEQRFDFYHRVEERVPFDIEMLNTVSRGGLPRKSLNIILAGTGVGKTLAMCHFAASNLLLGKNVLYITMEMAEEKIAERIDANLLNVAIDELSSIPVDSYQKKVDRVRNKTTGKLIIKEFPTASAHVGHLRHLLNELHLMRSFVPDIIYIDYLNICLSPRIKSGANVNSYTYVKAIAEELRGLAVEKNLPIISATQTTRSGYSNSDPGLEDTSESFGLPATADFMIALVSTEELQDLNQIMVKQLKNRYNDPTINKRFVVGVDRTKMRLYDLEENAQKGLVQENKPIMDNTHFGERINEDDSMKWMTKVAGRRDFSGLKN